MSYYHNEMRRIEKREREAKVLMQLGILGIIFAGILMALALLFSGCAVVSSNRVFPKLTFYWSKDAQLQREYGRQAKERQKEFEWQKFLEADGLSDRQLGIGKFAPEPSR